MAKMLKVRGDHGMGKSSWAGWKGEHWSLHDAVVGALEKEMAFLVEYFHGDGDGDDEVAGVLLQELESLER